MIRFCCGCKDKADDCSSIHPIEFHPDSRLIVFSGLRNEAGDPGKHFYQIDEKGKFVYLRSISKVK